MTEATWQGRAGIAGSGRRRGWEESELSAMPRSVDWLSTAAASFARKKISAEGGDEENDEQFTLDVPHFGLLPLRSLYYPIRFRDTLRFWFLCLLSACNIPASITINGYSPQTHCFVDICCCHNRWRTLGNVESSVRLRIARIRSRCVRERT